MSATQITLVQIDNYGPWTVTPEPRPEVDLQTLQSRLYADVCQAVGSKDGYAFYARFDNMVAVTNGFDAADLARIQQSVANRYPVTVSLSTAVDETPAGALSEATEQLQAAGSAQDIDRREVLVGETLAPERRTDDDVTVAHFDVVDSTNKYTDGADAFDAYLSIRRAALELATYMHSEHDSISYFVGGDNVIAVCPTLPDGAFEGAVDHLRESVDVELQVGVGTDRTPHQAGMAAKHALEECRYNGTNVERAREAVHGD